MDAPNNVINKEWLLQVIDACGLKPDIEQFKLGLEHLVGDQGSSLSGKTLVLNSYTIYIVSVWMSLSHHVSLSYLIPNYNQRYMSLQCIIPMKHPGLNLLCGLIILNFLPFDLFYKPATTY